MRKFILIFLIFLISFNSTIKAETKEEDIKPDVVSKSAILMDFKTGRVLWEKNSLEPMAMASTTKIMTAIITLEKGNLDDEVTISKRASKAPKVKLNLEVDEKIKLKYLLYALMLESSNDAAVAIAEHVGGSVENFCLIMNQKAKEIGAKDTIFETPNGLDQGRHHSTAYDLALISRYALTNEEFMKTTNTPNASFKSNKKSYSITNKNRLLSEYSGANGIKTGFTNKAGHCFVGAAKRDGMQLISVVLQSGWGPKGKDQKWKDTKSILNYGFKTFKYHDIIAKNDKAGTLLIDRSKTESLDYYFKEDIIIPLSDYEFKNIKVNIEAIDKKLAPVHKNEEIGVARVFIGNDLYKEIKLLADADVERHDLKTSMEKVLNDWFEMGTNNEIKIDLPEF